MHASICINHILDININSASVLVNHKGVEILCNTMQDFNYIDVAEYSIKALEKVSADYPDYILSSGGLPIMMNMIDFFIVGT